MQAFFFLFFFFYSCFFFSLFSFLFWSSEKYRRIRKLLLIFLLKQIWCQCWFYNIFYAKCWSCSCFFSEAILFFNDALGDVICIQEGHGCVAWITSPILSVFGNIREAFNFLLVLIHCHLLGEKLSLRHSCFNTVIEDIKGQSLFLGLQL